MAKYREEAYGQVLYQSFLDALQEFIGASAPNFHLSVANGTTIQVVAGANSAQVGLGIDGLWRYTSATVNSSVTGAAGAYDIFATCGANSFVPNPTPPPSELDQTVYAFGLQVLAQGSTPTLSGGVTNYRKVGEVDWDGSKITGFRPLTGEIDARSPRTPTAPTAAIVPLRVVGAAAQSANLQTWESSSGTVLARVSAAGGLTLSDAMSGTSASWSGGVSVGTTLSVGTTATVGGTLTVTGASAFAAGSFTGQVQANGAATSLVVANNATVGGTLLVTGAATFSGGIANTGSLTVTQDITARNGAATAVAIGAVGPAAQSAITFQAGETNSSIYRSGASALTSAAAWTLSGAGTALSVSNAASVGGALTVGGTLGVTGALTGSTASFSGAVSVTSGGIAVTGASSFANTLTLAGAGTGLSVTNNAAVGGTLGVTGTSTLAAVNASGVLHLTGGGTTLNVDNNATVGGTLGVTGATTLAALTLSGSLTLGEGNNLIVGTATGTKIGTATSQKLGFYNATPAIQVAAPTQAFVNSATDVTSGTAPSALGAASTLGDAIAHLSRVENVMQSLGLLGSGGAWGS